MDSGQCSQLQEVERLRKLDILLETYQSTEGKIIKGTEDGSSFNTQILWRDLIPNDGECISGLGIEGRVPTCLHCSCLWRLCRLEDGGTLKLEVGKLKGTCYTIRYLDPPCNCSQSHNVRSIATEVLGRNEPLNYIAMDNTSRSVLWDWISRIMSERNLGILMSYRCRTKVVTLKPCSLPLSAMHNQIGLEGWKLFLRSIIVLFNDLLPYQVTWVNPTPSTIGIEHEWDGSTCMPRLSLDGSQLSFATGNWRVIPYENERYAIRQCNWREWNQYFESCSWVEKVAPKPQNDNCGSEPQVEGARVDPELEVQLYSIDSVSAPMFTALRAIGIPLRSGSFELYCILVALYCIDGAREAVLSIVGIEGWKRMWPGIGHLEILEARCHAWERKCNERHRGKEKENVTAGDSKIPSYYDLLSILEGLWLRNDLPSLLLPASRP